MVSNNSSPLTPNSASLPIWKQPEIIRWSEILAINYRKLIGEDLINADTPEQLSHALFHAPFVMVSHGTQADPIFNYANQTALQLWGLNWDEFTKTPSAKSAEPIAREERAAMLKQAKEQGYIENYEGVRISSQGKRFVIKQVTLWNLIDEAGEKCGQAATYPVWEWLSAE